MANACVTVVGVISVVSIFISAILITLAGSRPLFETQDGRCPHGIQTWAESRRQYRSTHQTRGNIPAQINVNLCQAWKVDKSTSGGSQYSNNDVLSKRPLLKYSSFCLQNSNRFLRLRVLVHAGVYLIWFAFACYIPGILILCFDDDEDLSDGYLAYSIVAILLLIGSFVIALIIPFRLEKFELEVEEGFDPVGIYGNVTTCSGFKYQKTNVSDMLTASAILTLPAIIAITWLSLVACGVVKRTSSGGTVNGGDRATSYAVQHVEGNTPDATINTPASISAADADSSALPSYDQVVEHETHPSRPQRSFSN